MKLEQGKIYHISYGGNTQIVGRFIEEDTTNDDGQVIKWAIRENLEWGVIKNCRRQDSSLQKDWTVLPAHQLPAEFSIAVIGHQGWDKDIAKEVPYALAVSFEVLIRKFRFII